MTNRCLGLIIAIFITACGNSQEMPSKEAVNPSVQKSVSQITTNQATSAQSNYIRSTSRNAQDINTVYPYDIDLKRADGSIVNSSDAFNNNGKPTVILFWLTTCGPCRSEMKAIKRKYTQWKEEADFNLYAISIDFKKNYERFSKMVKDNNWPWEAFNDVNREFINIMPGNLNGLPQSFILDAKGEIVYHKRKWRPGDEDKLFAKVKSL